LIFFSIYFNVVGVFDEMSISDAMFFPLEHTGELCIFVLRRKRGKCPYNTHPFQLSLSCTSKTGFLNGSVALNSFVVVLPFSKI
jgi:hypothetical protein